MKFNLICPAIHTTSGYANHARGLLNALSTMADVKLSCGLPQGWERQTSDAELLAITKPDSQDRINIIIDLPSNWPLYLNKKKNICFCVFEGNKVPISWIENFKDSRVSIILVPSEKGREAIKNTTNDLEIIRKIKICPHGVDRSKFYPEDKKEKTFRFLCNKGFRNPFDRSGIQFALMAYIQEFKDEDVELFLKFNPAYVMNPDQFQAFLMQLGYQGKPKISASWDALNQDQLRVLYNSCDVFLNPTCGDAFSIPNLEAFACGKPSITTKDQLDYTNKNNSWEVEYEPFEVRHELLYEGISWVKPKIDSLRKTMREAFENRNIVEAKGAQSLIDSKDLTWVNSALKLVEYSKDLI